MPQFTYELDLPPGINSDDTGFAAKGRWADCSNVRFVNGKPETLGGVNAPGITLAGGICRAILPYNAGFGTGTSTVNIAYAAVAPAGSASEASYLYVSTGLAAVTDITPASGFNATGKVVSLAAWGTDLLASPRMGTLFQYTGSGVAAEVTQAPDQIIRMLVSSAHRQVIALGCTEVGGTFNGRCIRCCDPEDLTNWTPASDNNSDEVVLDGPGMIVAAEWVGEYVAVWTEGTIYLGQYVGDPSLVWRYTRAASAAAPLNAKTVTVVDGMAYWWGRDSQFYAWSPGGEVVHIPCPISRALIENLNVNRDATTGRQSTDTAVMGVIRRFDEIWLFYPDQRDAGVSQVATVNSRYVAFNRATGSWFRGILSREAIADLTSFLPDKIKSGGVIMADGSAGSTTIYRHENVAVTSTCPAWYIEAADQYINSARTRVMIRRADPDFETQTGDVSLTLYMRSKPQGDAVTKGPYTLSASEDKQDVRASGKIAAVRLSGSTGVYMRLGKPTFDCVTMGER